MNCLPAASVAVSRLSVGDPSLRRPRRLGVKRLIWVPQGRIAFFGMCGDHVEIGLEAALFSQATGSTDLHHCKRPCSLLTDTPTRHFRRSTVGARDCRPIGSNTLADLHTALDRSEHRCDRSGRRCRASYPPGMPKSSGPHRRLRAEAHRHRSNKRVRLTAVHKSHYRCRVCLPVRRPVGEIALRHDQDDFLSRH